MTISQHEPWHIPVVNSRQVCLVSIQVCQQMPASCEIVNTLPPMLIVPIRATPVLLPTDHPTVPPPLPNSPEVIVIHGALLIAIQSHPVALLTVTVPDPPLTPLLAVVDESI